MANTIDIKEVRRKLTEFAHDYHDAWDEKGEAQRFQLDFLQCFGISGRLANSFEKRIKNAKGNTGFIDGYVPDKLLIEMKSRDVDLDKAYVQAIEYVNRIELDGDIPPYLLVCDFAHFRLYSLDSLNDSPVLTCKLEELAANAEHFMFLTSNPKLELRDELPVNQKAVKSITALHDALYKNGFTGRELEVFLTRLLFCLFADDTGIFGEKQIFTRYLASTKADGTDLKGALETLFEEVLNIPENKRQKALSEQVSQFAYVNGDLFKERFRLPVFDGELRDKLIACDANIDWSKISPAIFGAMFQSVLETQPATKEGETARKELGAHYTSERNILRLINPLFMDDFWQEFHALAALGKSKRRQSDLQKLHDRIVKIQVLDPACGCGNFLVVTYRELRRLEHNIISLLRGNDANHSMNVDIRVSVSQFYGIEIDEAATHIARVAMYIADEQANEEANAMLGFSRPTVPIASTPNIICGNALQTDWHSVCPNADYIIGNPPFVGKNYRNQQQDADLAKVFSTTEGVNPIRLYKSLDFVAAWHYTATAYMKQHPRTKTAFVSTNSITQGEQVAILWQPLLDAGVNITFAHKTFSWSNDAKGKAAVHVVIIGFSLQDEKKKTLFVYDDIKGEPRSILAVNINPYLLDAPNVVVTARNAPIGNVPEMVNGSKPTDGGNLLLNQAEKDELIRLEPQVEKYLRSFVGAEEFINNTPRYCLWLIDCPPNELRAMPLVLKRVEAVKQMRLASTDKTTKQDAATPTLFQKIRQPKSAYLLVPRVSSENRQYVPIAFALSDLIIGDAAQAIPNATLYHFGVITSAIHNAWMRTIAGRLESRYRYSANLVYNNFPWAEPTDKQIQAIEQAAQAVIDARAKYPDSSLADLYDPKSMPPDLTKAHNKLDKAVDAAYGYKGGNNDSKRVAFLFDLYQQKMQVIE